MIKITHKFKKKIAFIMKENHKNLPCKYKQF